jgi:hypothetical protein
VAERAVSRGFSLADMNGDGKLDIVVANQWHDFSYFKNTTTNGNTALSLRVLEPIASAGSVLVIDGHRPTAGLGFPAVGAVVTVRTPDGRSQIALVDGGNAALEARTSTSALARPRATRRCRSRSPGARPRGSRRSISL